MASQRRFRCAGDPRYDFTLSVLRENVVAVLHLRVAPEPALRVVSLRRAVRHSGRAKRVGRRVIIERAPSSRCVGLRANHATLPQSKRRRLFVLSRLRQSRDDITRCTASVQHCFGACEHQAPYIHEHDSHSLFAAPYGNLHADHSVRKSGQYF